MRLHLMKTVCAASLLASAGWAETGLFLGNTAYDNWPDLRGAAALAEATEAFDGTALAVTAQADATAGALADALDSFVSAAAGAPDEGVVVLLSGRFVTSGAETWLLPVDAAATAKLTDLPRAALPLSTVLAVLADRPGHALLGLSTDDSGRAAIDAPFLQPGIGDFDIPQGVTVLRGAPGDLADFAARTLPRHDADILAEAAEQHDLAVSGYAPAGYAFLPAPPEASVPEASAPDPAVSSQETAAWDSARQADTPQAYRDYLAAYPRGAYADEARDEIDAISADPARSAEAAEAALELDRDARRAIQRDLTLLEFEPRGIDGIFGPGTRAAITAWQEDNDATATGYLTRDQIARLDGQAERRAIQLEQEAQARAERQAAEDRAFWDGTGAAGDEAGLRAYLDRYPDGIYSEQATAGLDDIRDRKRAETAEQDTAAWDRAAQADTPAAYRDYLAQFPDGAFSGDAQERIDAATRASEDAANNAQYAAEEDSLQMNAVTRQLLERRLAQLGLEPGSADGQFDSDTRKAIRNYQKARDLPQTGYVNQATVVRLLADVVLQ